MSDEHDGPGNGPEESDEDTGEPIAGLAEFGVSPRDGFLDRIRRRVERRVVATEFLVLTWEVPVAALKELLIMLADLLGSGRDDKGESP